MTYFPYFHTILCVIVSQQLSRNGGCSATIFNANHYLCYLLKILLCLLSWGWHTPQVNIILSPGVFSVSSVKLEGVEKRLAVVHVYISTVKGVDYYTIFHFHLHEQKSNNGTCIKYNDALCVTEKVT